MKIETAAYVPALITLFIGWRLYVRLRRSIGRQPLQPSRLIVRIVIFSLLLLLVGSSAVFFPATLAGLGIGVLIGAALAMVGIKLTKFEKTPVGQFYTPNLFLGLGVSLVFVGRLAYRFMMLSGTDDSLAAGFSTAGMMRSPLTLALFGVTSAYYAAYNVGVLVVTNKSSAPGSSDLS
jgi:hypothetical protein